MKPSMSFESTGLPQIEAVEKAYTYALKSHLNRFDEELKIAYQSVDNQLKQRLDMARQSGQYTPAQIEQLKAEQKKAAVVFKRQVEDQLLETRDLDFITRVVEPALVLSEGNNIDENAVNAILLIETIRSPKDYEAIKKDFGSDVSDIVADILDIEAYPSEQDKKLETLSDSGKRANLALFVGNLKSFIELGKSLSAGQKLILSSGQDGIKKKIEFASAVRGVDSKLDDMFVKIFNEVTQYVDTGVKVEVDKATNTLKIIPIKEPAAGSQGDGPSIGGDFFGNDGNTPPPGNFGGGKNSGPKIGGGF